MFSVPAIGFGAGGAMTGWILGPDTQPSDVPRVPLRAAFSSVAVSFRLDDDERARQSESRRRRSVVPRSELERRILRDLLSRSPPDRRFTRYLTTSHLPTWAGVDLRDDVRLAATYVLNTLSSRSELGSLHAIDAGGDLLRLDLRDFGWDRASTSTDPWQVVTSDYLSARVHDTPAFVVVRQWTDARLPILEADRFVALASDPARYETLLPLPRDLHELRRRLGLSESFQTLDFEPLVTRVRGLPNPLPEPGDAWLSYDVTPSEASVPPPSHRETSTRGVVFELPNGLHAYMTTDARGHRRRTPSASILCDALLLDVASPGSPPDDPPERLHPSAWDGPDGRDEDAHATALRTMGIDPERRATYLHRALSSAREDVDLIRAAYELGVPAETVLAELGRLPPPLQAWGRLGGTVPRAVWETLIPDTVRRLGGETESWLVASAAASRR